MRYLLPLLLLCGCASTPIPRTMGEIAPYDVKSAESFLYYNIRYLRDSKPEDEWRPCDKTLERGEGDCDDYAVCARELTALWPDCESRMAVVMGRKTLHAITYLWCKDKGIFGYFDNGLWYNGKSGYEMMGVRIGENTLPGDALWYWK